MARQNVDPRKKLLEEKVINLSRVTKVTKGGRHFRFSATVVVGGGSTCNVLEWRRMMRKNGLFH